MADIDTREVPGFPGYFVSRDGRLFSTRRGSGGWKRIFPNRRKDGYCYHGLMRDGSAVTIALHRIVALTWLDRPVDANVVRHLDGNPGHNHADNLAWGTQSENIQDKVRHGTLATGDRNGRRTHPESVPRGSATSWAKVNEEQVAMIRKRILNGEKGNALAREYGISKSAVSAIKNGRNWKQGFSDVG